MTALSKVLFCYDVKRFWVLSMTPTCSRWWCCTLRFLQFRGTWNTL